ncbi:MAG: phosphatase PAP2 family protein [Bacteroidota bacterium]
MKSTLFAFLLCGFSLLSAQSYVLPDIAPLPRASKHYAEFMRLPTTPDPAFAHLDTVAYPLSRASGYALAFTFATPHYLTREQVDFLIASVDPPANSSAQTRAEVAYLLDLQDGRTDPATERVMDLARIGYWPDRNLLADDPNYAKNLASLFFSCREVVGENCSAANYPATARLLAGLMQDMRLLEFAIKFNKRRARPYDVEPKIEPLQFMKSPSFASGHTLWAYIQAFALAELLPGRRQEFLDLAYEIGASREYMGVHYPSDEEAARRIAHRQLQLSWNTAKFQADFAAALAEWR